MGPGARVEAIAANAAASARASAARHEIVVGRHVESVAPGGVPGRRIWQVAVGLDEAQKEGKGLEAG